MEHRGRLAIGGCSRRHVSHSPGGPAIGCAIGDGSRCHVSRFPVGRPDPWPPQGTTCKAVRRRAEVSPPYAETERIRRRAARLWPPHVPTKAVPPSEAGRGLCWPCPSSGPYGPPSPQGEGLPSGAVLAVMFCIPRQGRSPPGRLILHEKRGFCRKSGRNQRLRGITRNRPRVLLSAALGRRRDFPGE